MYSVLNRLSEYTNFQMTLLHILFCLFIKLLQDFSVSLNLSKKTYQGFLFKLSELIVLIVKL